MFHDVDSRWFPQVSIEHCPGGFVNRNAEVFHGILRYCMSLECLIVNSMMCSSCSSVNRVVKHTFVTSVCWG